MKLKPRSHGFSWVPVFGSQKGAITILEKNGIAFEISNLYQERYLEELDAYCKEQKRVQREKQKKFKAQHPEWFTQYPKFSKMLAKVLDSSDEIKSAATVEKIVEIEKKLGFILPTQVREFFLITEGVNVSTGLSISLTTDYLSTNRRKTGCKSELFFEKKKNIFSGGEAVVDLWEDDLLDDDFSDEEESEELSEDNALDLVQDGFADWVDASDGAPEDERLEEALAEERTLELESELEQDEHPRDYAAELEDEEEEAALTSEKRLKREIRAEALRRLEEAARTESDFLTVVDEWNKLDRNRERRERDHENLRGDVPLEFQAVPEPRIAPLWMNLPRFRQLCQGNFLDIIFSCPYELHELTANRFLSKLFFTLSDEQKEVLYYLFVKQYSTTRLAAIRGQSDRNIRKLRMTIQKKLQRRMYEHLSEKLERDYNITLREREFVEEYEALLQTMCKDAVIRPENKTPPRKKKAALDDTKDG